MKMEEKKKKVQLKFRFKKSESDKTADEIIQTLVDSTVKRVLTEHQNKYYNRMKEYTS